MKLKYRPELDGLRAIAVSAVILYHAKITILGDQIFKGGFIGVDIFFVVSGYLITSIILNELVSTGSFSIKIFYERRIRRIFPTLIFVMLAFLPFAWMFLLPSSFLDFSKSILHSLGFTSNFYFHFSGQEYYAQSGFLKPFLHTWSLSAEVQYYVLFPIVLLITFKYFKNHLLTIMVIGLILSLQMSHLGSKESASITFYFLHTRMWEFLSGSILAYFEIKLGHRSKYHTYNLVFPSIGLFLIAHYILFFNDKIFHPSFHTSLPVLGVCLIIWFSNKDELITKILSSKLFVGIGLISYSLYLWHYPIFAFARVTDFAHMDLLKKLLIGLIIVTLSIFSYYFIELPSRNKKNKFKVIISLILISISVLVIFNFYSIQKDGHKNRLPEIFEKNFSILPWLLLKNEGKTCYENLDGCRFNIKSNKKIYIIGDSNMGSLMFDLKDRVIKNNYQFITFISGNCLFYPEFDLVDGSTMQLNNKCNHYYFEKIKKVLSKDKNSIFIFGGRFPLHLSNYLFDNQEGGVEGNYWWRKYVSVGKYKTIQESFINEILELSKNNKIILIYPVPEVGWHVPQKILNLIPKKIDSIKDYMIPENYITTSYKVYKNRVKSSFELLDSIQGNNISRVYPHTLFCDTTIKNRCLTHNDEDIFYVDDNHPSLKSAQMINDLIMKEIKKIELKSN
jgi:peptidoglycan/LPS O-acetylase OafA/YrhL